MNPRRHAPDQPTTPSGAFLDQMDAIVQHRLETADATFEVESGYPNRETVWGEVEARVENAREDLKFIVRDLHAHPEEALSLIHI